MIEQLFDHLPELVFFVKDHNGRYVVVNQSLVERRGLRENREVLGRHASDIFPKKLADRCAKLDKTVLREGQSIIDRLELHWYVRRLCMASQQRQQHGIRIISFEVIERGGQPRWNNIPISSRGPIL